MNQKFLFILSLFFCVSIAKGQFANYEPCDFELNPNSENAYVLNETTLSCLINQKSKFALYVYAYWCKPCVEELPRIIQFSNENAIDLFVLLISSQDSKYLLRDYKSLKELDLNILVLSDEYGRIPGKKRIKHKYKNFLKKYYPNGEVIDDMSKVIFYADGELRYVSDWQDGENVMETKIKPLL